MTYGEFILHVRAMRTAQKKYFAARRKGIHASAELELSKNLEKIVDTHIEKAIYGEESTLFNKKSI